MTHVVHDLHGGGFETLIASMARLFAGSSVTLSAISLSGRVGRTGEAIRPLLDSYTVMPSSTPWSMLAPRALAKAIFATRADVVHLHSGVWYKASLAARWAGVAGIVYTEHGRAHSDPVFMRWLDRRASRRTDAVVAVSDGLAAYLGSTVGIRPEIIVTIRNGVDTDLFSPGPAPTELRRQLGIPEHALVVGSIGRLETVKAYERLIAAVSRLDQAGLGVPVVAVIWGDGSERSALEARARAAGLGSRVLFPGWTSTTVLAHRLIDVFTLTSHSEGTSVSLLEALACGTAPVVMDVGANAEVVGPDLASQVTPPGDIEALAAVLADTLREPARRRALGAAGRDNVIAHYSLRAMSDRYQHLYEKLAGPLSTPSPDRD